VSAVGRGAYEEPANRRVREVLFDVSLTEQISCPLSDYIDEDGADARKVAELIAEEHTSLVSVITDLDLWAGSVHVQVRMPDGWFSRAEVVYGMDQTIEVRDA
jgi:hypothetical protein